MNNFDFIPTVRNSPPHSSLRLGLTRVVLCAVLGMQMTAWAQNTAPRVELADAIVVVVNDEVITRHELDEYVQLFEKRLKSRNITLPPPAEFRRQVLERMIVERAQLQLAKESGIRIDDATLDRYMDSLAEQNKLSPQAFRDQIERDGTPYARFREEKRDEIAMQRLREREVDRKLQISESDVDNYLAAQSTATQAPQEMDLAHIQISIPDNASAEQIAERRAKVEDILRQVKAGGDFAKLAATYSDAPDALNGGDIGWRSQDRVPQLFLEAVTDVKEGQVSAIVKNAGSFHIVKVLGRRNAPASANNKPLASNVQQTHARHILIKVNAVVTAADAIRKLTDIKQRLMNHAATFEELAKLYSNDSSASKGGDLGWIYPGDTVPQFENAMNALKPGEISDPIESPFGYHLIEVLERKTEDASKERQRQNARQAIRERKLDEAIQDWVRELRDRAYVEYRFDDNK